MSAGRGQYDRNGRPQTPTAKQADHTSRIENMIQYGTISQVDWGKNRYRVRTSPTRETGWLPMASGMADAGAVSSNPMQVGAQVAVLSPSGDQAMGFIIPGVYQDEHNRYDDTGDEYGTLYADGTHIGFNKETSTFDIAIPSGKVNLAVAGASIVVTENAIEIKVGGFTARFSAAGLDTTGGHVTNEGKHIDAHHTHGGILPGDASTSVPD